MFRDNIARRAGRIEIPYPCATSQMVPRQAANQAVRWSCVHRRFLLSLQGDLGRPIPPKKSLFSLPKSTPSRKFVLTLLFSLEMRGKELMPQLTLVEKPAWSLQPPRPSSRQLRFGKQGPTGARMTGMGIEQNMFCSLLTHHSLKHRSPRISVAAQRGPAPRKSTEEIYVGMNISNGLG